MTTKPSPPQAVLTKEKRGKLHSITKPFDYYVLYIVTASGTHVGAGRTIAEAEADASKSRRKRR